MLPEQYRDRGISQDRLASPGYGIYGEDYGSSSFFPQFPDPEHLQNFGRSGPRLPGFDYMLPGLGDNDSGIPFMPFDMF